jgi:16S rRNA (uracil1498-N3)-methyltransferase
VTFAADDRAAALVFSDVLDDALRIEGEDGRHLQRVRRLRAGERVTVADGAGRWRPYAIESVDPDRLDLRACGAAQADPRLTPRLTVAFALTKGDHPELVVQKVTELGVDRVVPMLTSRSVVRRRGPTGVDRLRRIAREAAAQSRRARIPTIDDVTSFATVAAGAGVLVADRDGHPPESVPEPPNGEWIVLVGPEGGFDDSERLALAELPRLAVGPHVLRAETAAIAAAAVLTTRRRPA